MEFSGSCAVVMLVIGAHCYVANVGDSRAILSTDEGRDGYLLTKDHKPDEEKEKTRILSKGGKIYVNKVPSGTTNENED